MNKTIHQLEELTQAEQTDELIVYDVSAGESKKITKENLQKKVYSTQEKIIGYWIDGTTPVYEKTIVGDGQGTTEQISIALPNVKVIEFQGSVDNEAGVLNNRPYGYSGSSQNLNIRYYQGNILIGAGYIKNEYIVIVRYIKLS